MSRYIGSLQTDTYGILADEARVAHITFSAAQAAAASNTGVHAAHTDDGSEEILTTDITNPPCPRNITATAGGTDADIKAIQVVIVGTNIADEVITETLPAFTVNTPGTVVGNKAFKTVTKITIPAHDGNGATTAIGFGDKLGLPFKLDKNYVDKAIFNGVKEATAPSVAVSSSTLESNTIDLNSALNGSVVDVYLTL